MMRNGIYNELAIFCGDNNIGKEAMKKQTLSTKQSGLPGGRRCSRGLPKIHE